MEMKMEIYKKTNEERKAKDCDWNGSWETISTTNVAA